MAYGDYRHCDVCDAKAFYDAGLNYDSGYRSNADGKFIYPDKPFRIAGKVQRYGSALGTLGDWAVLCLECAKMHRVEIVRITEQGDAR